MNKRRIETYLNDQWIDIEFKDLKETYLFRMFDDGELYTDNRGKTQWLATSEPYLNKDGILTINTI